MHGLEQAQRHHDRQLPKETEDYFRQDELEAGRDKFDDLIRDMRRPRRMPIVTDSDVENFLAELVASKDKDLFLEEKCGYLPRMASNELVLHVAVAEQWVKNKEAVGETIGPVFWTWAKHAAIEAAK